MSARKKPFFDKKEAFFLDTGRSKQYKNKRSFIFFAAPSLSEKK